MPLIELKLIGHGASAADMDAAEARLLGEITPWLVGQGNEEPAQQILSLLGARPLYLQEGESRGALLAMCHPHPGLEASFSHCLPCELDQLTGGGQEPCLTIGSAGPGGVPLLLCADGQRIGQQVKLKSPGSRERPPNPRLRRPRHAAPPPAGAARCSPTTSTLTRTASRID